jgi:hypothetical protein
MSKVYIDTETCGLHGMAVLLQYAEENGPITLHEIWRQPIHETLTLIEWIALHTVVGFNLAFDWFHLCKIYTIFRLCDPNWIPEEHIEEIALVEPKGQEGPCLKPFSALDLMLHARKGPMQSLMGRDDVRIKRVPTVLAYVLAAELEQRIKFDNIYFAKSYDPEAPKWQVFDRHDRRGEIDPDFKDVVLKFNPAGGLKFLAEYLLKKKPKFHYKDVEPKRRPIEVGYAPTALSVSNPFEEWVVAKKGSDGKYRPAGHAWPGLIKENIEHWALRADAREYAQDDIVYTRELDHYFGDPTPGDDDSVLSCMVAAIRWRGFVINIDGVAELAAKSRAVVASSPVNVNKPKDVKAYVMAAMDAVELTLVDIETSTKKAHIEAISGWEIKEPEPCTLCLDLGPNPECPRCGGLGTLPIGLHPAAARAKEILDVRVAMKEVELYQKLLRAGKFHASFIVIGTLSTRMSGGDGLNPQGIKHTTDVRCMFPLAWPGYILCGGDFDSFEVTLADAVYNDPGLRSALTTKVECHKCFGGGKTICKKHHKEGAKIPVPDCPKCVGLCENCDGSGRATKKLHGLFAMEMYPGKTYEDILASDGKEPDYYTKGKQGVFAMIYGGDWNTLVKKYHIDPNVDQKAEQGFFRKFPGVRKAREKTFKLFCSMTQPEGLGKAVVWAEPAEYIESFLGFRRYFTLENKIAKTIFQLAHRPPKHWKIIGDKIKVCRRDRVQFAVGAVQSALYGAAFAMQATNMRAAANHEIQSPGAQITKVLERRIWDLQPAGVHEFVVAPLNIHDELMIPTLPDAIDSVATIVHDVVESFRPQVPLIGMTWNQGMQNWAEKKGGAKTMKIRAPILNEM